MLSRLSAPFVCIFVAFTLTACSISPDLLLPTASPEELTALSPISSPRPLPTSASIAETPPAELSPVVHATPAPAEKATTLEEQLPAPPDGYDWQIFQEVGAAFLVPTGWHFLHETAHKTEAYFVSVENIDEIGYFSTGLSVNVIHNDSFDAVEYGKAWILARTQLEDVVEVLDFWELAQGPLAGYVATITSDVPATDPSDPNLRRKNIHNMGIGNQNTNTLYLITYESPIEEWDEAWEIGQTILQSFALDPEE